MRVQVVGEDGVLGACKPAGTVFHLLGEKHLCHALEGHIDEVVGGRALISEKITHVFQELKGVQVVGVNQGQQIVGIQGTAAQKGIDQVMMGVHG